jgi:RNA polymerase sigma-70 factor (ECF subfamily)
VRDAQKANAVSFLTDVQALTLLYEQFRRSIYSYAYHLLGNQEDAADVTQEVFLRACLNWERLRDREHLSVWLHQVATNLCVDLLRRRKRHSWWPLARSDGGAIDGVSENEPFSHVPSGSGGIPEVAEREQIQRVFARMPQDYAIVLILSVVQGFPYQEIAAITGLSPAAAATRLSRAKRMFVEQYQCLYTDDIGRQEDRP